MHKKLTWFFFFIFNIFCPKVYCTKHFYKVVTPLNLFSLSSFSLLLVYFLFVGSFYVSYSGVVVLIVSLSLFLSLQCHDELILPSFGKTCVSYNPLAMSSHFFILCCTCWNICLCHCNYCCHNCSCFHCCWLW